MGALLGHIKVIMFQSVDFIRAPPAISVRDRDNIASVEVVSTTYSPTVDTPPDFPPYATTPDTARSSKFGLHRNSFPIDQHASSGATNAQMRPPAEDAVPESTTMVPTSRDTYYAKPTIHSVESVIDSSGFTHIDIVSVYFNSPFAIAVGNELVPIIRRRSGAFLTFSTSSHAHYVTITSFHESAHSIH